MAGIWPLKPTERTGDQAGTWKWEEFNDTDYIADSALANPALPPIWDAAPAYAIGDTVFYNGHAWVTRAAIPENTNTPPSISRSSNWERVGASITRLQGSDGTTPGIAAGNGGFHELRFIINQVDAGTTPTFGASTDSSVSGNNDGLITLNLPPIPTSGGGGGGNVDSVGVGNGIANAGSATAPVITFDYTDPETLVRLLTQTNKSLTFDANGLPSSASATLQPASGTTQVSYFIDYTFTNGLPTQIDYYEGASSAGTLRAVKRVTYDANGLPDIIRIGAV